MFFGGSVIGVTSATASFGSWKTAIRTRKVALLFRQIIVQLTFLFMLAYSFYFWTTGFRKFKTFPDVCDGTFVFPISRRVSLKEPSFGSVFALLLLVVIYICIWYVSYKRLQRSFRTKNGTAYEGLPQAGEEQVTQSPPWEKRQRYVGSLFPERLRMLIFDRPWTILGGTLITFVIIWAIAGIELTLKWNRVTGINDLLTTGQLIPFVMGIASLPAAVWGVVEYVQEAKNGELKFSQIPVSLR